MRKLVLLFSLVLFASFQLSAQNRRVSGTVTGPDGSPVAGVTVVVSGTNTASITIPDGSYSISAPADASLEFSFLGMVAQTVPVSGRTVVNVQLENDAQQVEAVVVLGLGVTRTQKSTGYATQRVDPGVLTQTRNTSLAGALQGKLSGVDITPSSGMPGSSSLIVIRGARSFTGNNTPLYIVDGMPINSGIDVSTYDGNTGNGGVSGSDYANRGIDIDPNDIESIQILKGQAASALYGMRASNGVVMITTSRGAGSEKGRTNVTFNTSVTIDRISRMPDFQTTYGQGDFVPLAYNEGRMDDIYAYNPNSSNSWGPKIADLANDPVYGYGGTGPTSAAAKATWGKWIGSANTGEYYVPQRANAGLDPWVKPQVYENRIKDFFNTGVTTNNSVNISKTTDQSIISATLSAANQTGIVPSTGMDRYNAKLLGETKMGRSWTLGFSGNYVNTRVNKSTAANGGLVATLYPAPPSYDLMGIPDHYEGHPEQQNAYRSTSGFDAATWSVRNNVFQENTGRFFGNAFVAFKPDLNTAEHNLNFRLQVGTDTYATKYHEVYGYGHLGNKGETTERLYDVNNFNGTFTANYDWAINDKLRLDVSAGSEFIHENTKRIWANGMYFNFPGWNHMNNATVFNTTESRRELRTVGFFGTATLAYANQLYFTVTGREDVVSSMPTNNRRFFYPSSSLSWAFTELEALNNRVLNYGKLRVAVAQVGQRGDYYEPYYETPLYGGGFYSYPPMTYPYNGVTPFVPASSIYDPNLKPQNTNSIEAGFDLSFWNGVLGFNYTYSYQNVTGQIFAIPAAASTGIASQIMNGGKIETKAHEATLTVSPRLGKDFSWVTAFNLTAMDNRVKELAAGVENIQLGGFVEPNVRAAINDKFPSIYGTSFRRDGQGRIVYDANNMPIADAAKILGSPQPKFILGMSTTFSWKKISLAAVLDWKNGGQMYGGTARLLDSYGVSEISRKAREEGIAISGVREDGTPFTDRIKPEQVFSYFSVLSNISEGSIYDTSFVKMRELSLSYDFKVGPHLNMGVNVFARNLLLWTNYPNLDPESSQGNDNMAGAFERFSLPQTSSFGMGLSFKF